MVMLYVVEIYSLYLQIEMLIRIIGFGKQMLNLLEIIDILMVCNYVFVY